ncbi:hypothetical protein AVEN_77766-1, partial [Araneus ventricosus]
YRRTASPQGMVSPEVVWCQNDLPPSKRVRIEAEVDQDGVGQMDFDDGIDLPAVVDDEPPAVPPAAHIVAPPADAAPSVAPPADAAPIAPLLMLLPLLSSCDAAPIVSSCCCSLLPLWLLLLLLLLLPLWLLLLAALPLPIVAPLLLLLFHCGSSSSCCCCSHCGSSSSCCCSHCCKCEGKMLLIISEKYYECLSENFIQN